MTQLITENECRRLLFSKQSRPSPRQFAAWRDKHDLPFIRLGGDTGSVYYFREDVEDHLRSMAKPRHTA